MAYIRAFGFALLVFIVIFTMGGVWFFTQCEPLGIHGYSEPNVTAWQCYTTGFFPVAASLFSGALLGALTRRYAFWLGLLVPCFGLLALQFTLTGVVDIWHGTDLVRAAVKAVTYCLLPSAVMGWFVQSVASRYRRAL